MRSTRIGGFCTTQGSTEPAREIKRAHAHNAQRATMSHAQSMFAICILSPRACGALRQNMDPSSHSLRVVCDLNTNTEQGSSVSVGTIEESFYSDNIAPCRLHNQYSPKQLINKYMAKWVAIPTPLVLRNSWLNMGQACPLS